MRDKFIKWLDSPECWLHMSIVMGINGLIGGITGNFGWVLFNISMSVLFYYCYEQSNDDDWWPDA